MWRPGGGGFSLPESLGKCRQRRERNVTGVTEGAPAASRRQAEGYISALTHRILLTARGRVLPLPGSTPRRNLSPELLLNSGHYSSPTPSQGAPRLTARASDYASHAKGRTSSLPGVLRTRPGCASPAWAPLPACPPETPRALLSGGRGLPSRRNRARPVLRSPVCFWGKTYLLGDSPVRQCAHFLKCSP